MLSLQLDLPRSNLSPKHTSASIAGANSSLIYLSLLVLYRIFQRGRQRPRLLHFAGGEREAARTDTQSGIDKSTHLNLVPCRVSDPDPDPQFLSDFIRIHVL